MVRVNLLPIREILRKRELKQFLLLTAVIVASTFGLMVCTAVFFSWKISALEKDKTVHETKLNQLKEKNKEIEELKNRIARLQRQVDTIEKLTKIRDTPAPFMEAIALAIPDEVWLISITKTGQSFALDGVGVDNTVAVNFVQRLQRIKQGATVKQPEVNPAVPTDKSFFSDVKLLQIVAAGRAGGLGTMSFKIVGNVR
ncbi:MAG: PilN domain-containing protein [Desulfomonilaceae bacterium]